MIEGQTTIFDMLYPKYKITKPIRLIEFFGGYGSQALALKYLGVKFEHWKLVEWAVKSIQAYKDIHFTDYKCSRQPMTKEELKEEITKKFKIKYIADNVGISTVYLSNILNSKVTIKKAIAYCITKMLDNNKEIDDFFIKV